jgi:DHA1 family tetracycline resistance protein-like MFS transporter
VIIAVTIPSEPAPRRTGSLLIVFLTVFIDLLGFGMVIPLLPIYADQFTLDKWGIVLGLLMASFSAMQFFFSPLWGRLSDRIGRRPVLLLSLLGSVVFYGLFGVATLMESLALLFVARIGAGIAGATIATAQAYIADTTSLQSRPRGMALIGMAFGMGFTFGPLLGFLAAPTRDARPGPWPGFAAAILSAAAFALAVFLLPESLSRGAQPAERTRATWTDWREALSVPSIGLLLVAMFVCVFSFAMFETTLSLLIKGSAHLDRPIFDFSWKQVCLTYAFIGLTLTVVQGGVVRRLAGKLHEGLLAASGALMQVLGFILMLLAAQHLSVELLAVALVAVVSGFAFMQPNLQSLLSRRSDPARQGLILGFGQSVSALARIAGAGVGIPLLRLGTTVPYITAANLMGAGLILVWLAARSGRDFGPPPGVAPDPAPPPSCPV